MAPTDGPDALIRPAVPDDAPALARIHLRAREAAMPPGINHESEVVAWVAANIDRDEVWVVDVDDAPAAYLRLTETWLDDLYVDPDHQGAGIGAALLSLAKARRPGGFGLWVFEMNTPARGFYAAHGLAEVERTDGADNEEQMPDIRMEWPGS